MSGVGQVLASRPIKQRELSGKGQVGETFREGANNMENVLHADEKNNQRKSFLYTCNIAKKCGVTKNGQPHSQPKLVQEDKSLPRHVLLKLKKRLRTHAL